MKLLNNNFILARNDFIINLSYVKMIYLEEPEKEDECSYIVFTLEDDEDEFIEYESFEECKKDFDELIKLL